MAQDDLTDDEIRSILLETKRWAVIGVSEKPQRDSHRIAMLLRDLGKTVYPVNPKLTEWEGLKCYDSVLDIPDPVEVVDVFRRPEDVVPHAKEAVDIAADVIWFQLGVVNEDAIAIARKGGLRTVVDRCPAIETRRLDLRERMRRQAHG